MANIAKTGVTIVTKAAGFVSGLRSARNAFKGFNRNTSRGAKSWSNSIGSSFASTIAKITILTLALRKVMRTVLSEFTNLDEARKFAQSIGQAGKFATDKLLAFEYAAKRVGASTAVARTGLRTMSKAIGEAQLGLGEGVQAMRILGLDARKLGTMLPTEAFLEISKAINGMANSSVRTAAAQKLFGRAGVRMLNLARLQGKSIEELINRHKQLAGVMSEADIAGVEAVNDSITDLVTAYKGLQRVLIAAVSPALFAWLTTAANLFASLRKKLAPFGAVINKFLIETAKKSITLLPGVIRLIKGIAIAIWNGLKAVKEFGGLLVDLFALLGQKMGLFGNMSVGLMEVSIALAFVGKFLEKLPEIAQIAFRLMGVGFEAYGNTVIGIMIKISRQVNTMFYKMGNSFIDTVLEPIANSKLGKMLGLDESLNGLKDALGEVSLKRQQFLQELEKKNILNTAITDMKLFSAKHDFKGMFKGLSEEARAEAEKMMKTFNGALKQLEKIKKGAEKRTKDSPFGGLDEKGKKSKEQFGAFAELGSQEASRLLANADEGDKIQREQLGVLRNLVQVVRTGNDKWEGFLRDQYHTGGVVTR